MTRAEFIENVTTWYNLIDFCYNEDYELEDVYDEDQRDSYLDETLADRARSCTWKELRDELNEVPDSESGYYHLGYYDWEELDDTDFENYLEEVLDWADSNDIFDDEDEGEETIEEEPVEEDTETEEIEATDLLGMCSENRAALRSIREAKNIQTIHAEETKTEEETDDVPDADLLDIVDLLNLVW